MVLLTESLDGAPDTRTHCGGELARERARKCSENSAPDTSSSRASSLPQGSYCIQSAERLRHALTVGANLLAKGPVQAPKTARLIHRVRERAPTAVLLTASLDGAPAKRTHCGSELARERAGTGSENSAPDQSPSRASSLPEGPYCIQSAERLPHALTVRASLLAKGPVQAPKTARLIHRIRERARSHSGLAYCITRRSACHTHSLWERACSRKGLTASTAVGVLRWICSAARRLPRELPGGGLRRGGRLRFRAVRRLHRLRPPAHRIHRSAPW